MAEVRIFYGGDRFGPVDVPPATTAEAAAVVRESLQLAWAADRAALVGVVVVTVAGTAAELATLTSGRSVLEAVLARRELRSQASRLGLFALVGVAAVGGEHLSRTLQHRIAEAARVRAEGTVLEAIATLELADIEDPDFQDRMHKALSGAGRQAEVLRRALSLPQAAAGLATGVLAAGPGDRALVPLALGGAVVQWRILARTQDESAMFRRPRHMREAMTIRSYLTGAQAAHELRAFGAAPLLLGRHAQLADDWMHEQRETMRKNGRRMLVTRLAGRVAGGPAAGRLLAGLANRRTSVPAALTDGLAAKRVNGGFQRLVGELSGVRRMASSVGDYRDFLAEAPAPATNGRGPSPHFERIVAEGLSFTYRGGARPVLAGVDLEIGRGEVVALVGENGCGKTTLAKLLCCLYRPTGGTIRWDDVDLAACDPAAVRARIAVVFQDFVRYSSLTAAENIGIGMPARMGDRAAIVAAATQAGAHDVIAALPDGYDTRLSRGFGGVDLSTGQWQRVALARAFLRDAPLVVLDEPTAALDPRAERDLFETVASLYRSRSALLISHRLSSVRFADRICVLAGGRITETGSHDELLAAGGTYAELFEMQARAYR